MRPPIRPNTPKRPPRALSALWLAAAVPSLGQQLNLLVPAYQYPTLGPMWTAMAQAQAANLCLRLHVILNPGSGPGYWVDPAYSSAVSAARAAGASVYGYVYTSYAARPQAMVLAEVDRYLEYYPAINGILLDEMDTQPASGAYYAALTGAIHDRMPGGLVLGNPGTSVPESFLPADAVDTFITYENGGGRAAYAAFPPPAWVAAYPSSRFGAIVYAEPDAGAMRSTLSLAASRNVGWVYVTDDTLPNPYDTLPAYWGELVAAASRPACPADFNCDGFVDLFDYDAFISAFESGRAWADVNADGFLDFFDSDAFVAAFDSGC